MTSVIKLFGNSAQTFFVILFLVLFLSSCSSLSSLKFWGSERLKFKKFFNNLYPSYKGKFFFSNHHISHAASAFLPSGFKEAAILTVDGVGENVTATISKG